MAIYKDIIKQIGNNLEEYNVGAWALFRDQMATEVNSQFLFLNGERSDESLLTYSMDNIQTYNNIVRGRKDTKGKPKFTYYTEDGPQTQIEGNPILVDPNDNALNITSDFKPNLDETTYTKYNGSATIGEYDDRGRLRKTIYDEGIDKVVYEGNITSYNNGETLLSKTKRWFQSKTNDYISRRYATLISRFHTDEDQLGTDEIQHSVALQAPSNKFGLSHGRNLLKVNELRDENGKKIVSVNNDTSSGYSDPYCRVWTWHKQYAKFVKDTMRPFNQKDQESPYGYSVISQSELSQEYNWKTFRSATDTTFAGGGFRLSQHGVMFDNNKKSIGLVNITPSMDVDSEKYDDNRNVSVEHCMFSIENLAWKGTYGDWDDVTEMYGLSREQKGPLGGRIMWFPPYDLKFSEDTNATWQSNEFIGRGEPIYTYANTTRSGSLSFKLLIDHPSVLDYWDRRKEIGTIELSGVDNVDSKEQELLRFFAGCSILSARDDNDIEMQKPQQEQQKEEEPTIQEEPKIVDDTMNERVGPPPTDESVDNVIQFFVFYPNNYSGVDDWSNQDVDPIKYLMNGVGTQKCRGWSADDYLNDRDLPTETNKKYYYNDGEDDIQIGGYEMRPTPTRGISVVDEPSYEYYYVAITDDKHNNYSLVKMAGDKAVKDEGDSEQNEKNKLKYNKYRYYYRADKSTLNQLFKATDDDGAASYIDKGSHGFNLNDASGLVSNVILNENSTTYSMAEVFAAVMGYGQCQSFRDLLNGHEDRIEELRKILYGEKGKIKKIYTTGRASAQGNNKSKTINDNRNLTLAENRAKTIDLWLQEHLDIGEEMFDVQYDFDKDTTYKPNESSDQNAKLNRFALVEIVYGGAEVEDSSKTGVSQDSISGGVGSNETLSGTLEGNEQETTSTTYVDNGPQFHRYDNEARFFTKLRENDPFMAKLLSERIKNFDPVFHSMSPEGFNARLTFLNQCMRQGPTISWTDNMNKFNANNMAFGRPPVCVLRVGDFYNTKIIINSLNITYDPLLWDLNQEGIGVMPMIANITLHFYFIGGSDIAGPIQRLQNATSFNYYANTSIYDNRSEMIEYKRGEYDRFKASPM